MPDIPRDPALDSTLALLLDPYRFIVRRCRRHGSDVFQARIQFQETLCLTGPEAARLFYDPQRFLRQGAAPLRVQNTLFGKGGVQTLDGEAHRHQSRSAPACTRPPREARPTWSPGTASSTASSS